MSDRDLEAGRAPARRGPSSGRRGVPGGGDLRAAPARRLRVRLDAPGYGDLAGPRRPHRRAPAGILLLVGPGTRDRYAWDPAGSCRHAYVHFTVQTDADPARWPVCRPAEPDGPLPGLLSYLLWLGSRAPGGWQDRVDDVLGLLLATYVDGPLPEPDPPLSPVLGAVVDHVRAAWGDGRLRQVSLGELAGAASVSTGYLARQFRRQYGVGPVTAFERLRLARSASMLLRSNYPIAVIAERCGFADQYHFSRRFSAAYGSPPSRYRRLGSGADADSALAGARLFRLADQVWPRS